MKTSSNKIKNAVSSFFQSVIESLDCHVWIECDPSKMDYESGRNIIRNLVGIPCGSGSGFGGWDVSFHSISKNDAIEIANKVKNLDFVKSVEVYRWTNDKSDQKESVLNFSK